MRVHSSAPARSILSRSFAALVESSVLPNSALSSAGLAPNRSTRSVSRWPLRVSAGSRSSIWRDRTDSTISADLVERFQPPKADWSILGHGRKVYMKCLFSNSSMTDTSGNRMFLAAIKAISSSLLASSLSPGAARFIRACAMFARATSSERTSPSLS
ncbi:hypothetical protein AAKU55_003404 [Oxalobacteraceae bacterium GrIS 1.11]